MGATTARSKGTPSPAVASPELLAAYEATLALIEDLSRAPGESWLFALWRNDSIRDEIVSHVAVAFKCCPLAYNESMSIVNPPAGSAEASQAQSAERRRAVVAARIRHYVAHHKAA